MADCKVVADSRVPSAQTNSYSSHFAAGSTSASVTPIAAVAAERVTAAVSVASAAITISVAPVAHSCHSLRLRCCYLGIYFG